MYLDNKIITLNSAFATTNNGTYNSDVVFNFNSILGEDETVIRSYVSVMNAQIPSSFYIINETNNILTYHYISLLYQQITLTKGNYNANTLITEIQNKLGVNGTPISITINKLNGVLTFTASSQFYIYENPLSSVLGLFKEIGSETQTNIGSVGGVIVADYPLNLLGVRQLLIKSSSLAISSFDSKTLGITDTITSIPCNVPPFGLVLYESKSDLDKHVLASNSIEQIDIRITDERDNLINFNNLNWSITLCLSVERKDEPDRLNPNLLPYVKDLEPNTQDKPKKESVDEELKLLES